MASERKNDNLFTSLKTVARILKVPFQERAVLKDLPKNEKLLPSTFVRAAKLLHLKAKIVHQPLIEITKAPLPIVLILEQDDACVITSLKGNSATLYTSDKPDKEVKRFLSDLDKQYTGYAIPVSVEEQTSTDNLLICLKAISRILDLPFSKRAVLSELPTDEGKLLPSTFVRAARKLNLKAKIIYRKLRDISNLVLPAVLILKNDDACILMKKKKNMALVISTKEPDKEIKIPLSELKKAYSGYAILINKEEDYEERAKQYQRVMKGSWFWKVIWRFKGVYYNIILAAFLINIFSLAVPLYIMSTFDRVIPNFAVSTLWALTIGISIIFLIDFILRHLRNHLIDTVGQKMDILLATELFSHVLKMTLKSKPESAGAFANNLRDFDVLRDFFTSAMLSTIVDLPFIIIFLSIIGYLGGSLALIPILAVLIVIISTQLFKRPMQKSVENSKIGAAQKHAILTETINNIETIKATATEAEFISKWETNLKKVSNAGRRFRTFSSITTNFTMFIQQFSTVVLVVMGVFKVESAELTIGGLLACIILNSRALAPLAGITNILSRIEISKLALMNLNQIMAEPVERPSNVRYLEHKEIKGDVVFDKVFFSYPSQPHNALNGLDLKIKAGERVGIIGKMGAGKSTITRLCLGLYQIERGKLFIDDADVMQIDPADLRANIGYCSQDCKLFYGSIRENIMLGRQHADDDVILKLSALFGVNQFVNQHPAGFDLQIGETGEVLSLGQRQSICLLRALIHDPKVIILDEPTSSMDSGSEAVVMKGLLKYLDNQTLILTTHRRSLLRLVDRVVVIDKGKVVMDGRRDEVLRNIDNK